jgi:hypothetical protein
MSRKPQRVWRRVTPRRKPPVVPEREREAIILACERFVRDVLKPRFLPEIIPTEWNYPVDIRGAWHGGRYRFIQRFRSDRPDSIVPEFDAPFARIEWVAPGLFDVAYHRYTGEWRTIFHGVSLEEALRLIESETLLNPA